MIWLAMGLAVATAGLLLVGLAAIRGWTRGTNLLIQQQSNEALALVGAGLHRDMEGAWRSLLVPLRLSALAESPPYDLYEPVAQSFARFPYVESVITWSNREGIDSTFVFNRTERRPPWAAPLAAVGPFPVELMPVPEALERLVDDLRSAAHEQVVLNRNVVLAGVPYQIIAQLLYSPSSPRTAVALGAITINTEWVRGEYFAPLVSETVKVGGNEGAIAVTVKDDRGLPIAQVGRPSGAPPTGERRFAFLFTDPALIARPVAGAQVVEWSVSVTPAPDGTLAGALQQARIVFVLLLISTIACTLALLLTVRAVRARSQSATMQSEFVAAVTHELKTPLVVVRLVGDTLSSNRFTSLETIREYARTLSLEASRLSRTIDRLLEYARHGESVSRVRRPQLTDVRDLVDVALEEFAPVLDERGFTVDISVPRGLPKINVERDAVVHAMETIIENAVKYSKDKRVLRVHAVVTRRRMTVTLSDAGVGIHADDLRHVLKRFYRGQSTEERGSGLGLAIAERVMKTQGGSIEIQSTEGRGTSVALTFPITRKAV